MALTTFRNPVRGYSGFNPHGAGNVINISAADGNTSLTVADHGGRIITWDDPDGVLTLPEIVATTTDISDGMSTSNLGVNFRIYISTAATAMNIDCAGTDEFRGFGHIAVDGTGADLTWFAEAADNFVTIVMNGSTRGGRVGSWIDITAVQDGIWYANLHLLGSGTPITCWSV